MAISNALSALFDRPQPAAPVIRTPRVYRGYVYFHCTGGLAPNDGEPKHYEWTNPFSPTEPVKTIGEEQMRREIRIALFSVPVLKFATLLPSGGTVPLCGPWIVNAELDSIYEAQDGTYDSEQSWAHLVPFLAVKFAAEKDQAKHCFVDTATGEIFD